MRIPDGQSRSHWNSHSWVSCSESAAVTSSHAIFPPFSSPTVLRRRKPISSHSQTWSLLFVCEVFPYNLSKLVPIPQTCLDLVSRHICLLFLTNNNTLPVAHILFAYFKRHRGSGKLKRTDHFSYSSFLLSVKHFAWMEFDLSNPTFDTGMLGCLDLGAKLIRQSVIKERLKFTEPHRLSRLQIDLLPPNKTLWAAWSVGNLIDLNQTNCQLDVNREEDEVDPGTWNPQAKRFGSFGY